MTPLALAEAFCAALNDERWEDAAAFVAPDWLDTWWNRHFARLCEGFKARERARELGQAFSGYGSDGRLRGEDLARFADEVLAVYPGRPTLRELSAKPPLRLLALVLQLDRHGFVAPDDTLIPLQYRALRARAKAGGTVISLVKEPRDPARRSKGYSEVVEVEAREYPVGWRLDLSNLHLFGPSVFFPDEESGSEPAAG